MKLYLTIANDEEEQKLLDRLYHLWLDQAWQNVVQTLLCTRSDTSTLSHDAVLALTGLVCDASLLMFLKLDTDDLVRMQSNVDAFLVHGRIQPTPEYPADFYEYGCVVTNTEQRENVVHKHHNEDFFDAASALWVWLEVGIKHGASLVFV